MTERTMVQIHNELTAKALAIVEAKNHDYRGGQGDLFANFRGSVSLGIPPVVGVMLRMQDKMMRIKTFVERGTLAVKAESAEDAVIDLINYSVIMGGLLAEMRAAQPALPRPGQEHG